MKIVGTILKILVALAAVAGVIYVIATYGDKIVAWAKKKLGHCTCCCEGDCDDCLCEDDCNDCACDCCCENECCCDCEEAVEAEDQDFEG